MAGFSPSLLSIMIDTEEVSVRISMLSSREDSHSAGSPPIISEMALATVGSPVVTRHSEGDSGALPAIRPERKRPTTSSANISRGFGNASGSVSKMRKLNVKAPYNVGTGRTGRVSMDTCRFRPYMSYSAGHGEMFATTYRGSAPIHQHPRAAPCGSG